MHSDRCLQWCCWIYPRILGLSTRESESLKLFSRILACPELSNSRVYEIEQHQWGECTKEQFQLPQIVTSTELFFWKNLSIYPSSRTDFTHTCTQTFWYRCNQLPRSSGPCKACCKKTAIESQKLLFSICLQSSHLPQDFQETKLLSFLPSNSLEICASLNDCSESWKHLWRIRGGANDWKTKQICPQNWQAWLRQCSSECILTLLGNKNRQNKRGAKSTFSRKNISRPRSTRIQ